MTEQEKLEHIQDKVFGGMSKEEAEAFTLESWEVAQNMQQRGGSFVRLLGVALQAADIPNALKIKTAFQAYWEKYSH